MKTLRHSIYCASPVLAGAPPARSSARGPQAQLDLGTLGFQRAVPAETGRPGYDPGDLLRLYLYGYLHRIRSSRRLEQETHRNVELRWLLRRLTPDFKTIADFRRDHPAALKGVGRECILLCKRLDRFGGELLAIDGSKFRAVNARDQSYPPAHLATWPRDIDRTIARYLRELERQDEAEAGTEGPSADARREKITALQQRRARSETLPQELATTGATALSLTDPNYSRGLEGDIEEFGYSFTLFHSVSQNPQGERLHLGRGVGGRHAIGQNPR